MTSITVTAPAKVNLFLKVLSKRKDSYHNILTLLERISLADKIKISKILKGIIVKSDKLITRNPKDNLVYRAAEMILKHGRIKSGVKIEIKKRIPIAAGLGGGSSDAAAVLIGLNKLFRLRLNNNTLSGFGKKLGADVPFFILNTPFAIGRSKGDVLKTVHSKSRFWHLLIYPGFKMATKDVYKAFDSDLLSKYLTLRCHNDKIFFPSDLWMDYTRMEAMLYNDLESAAISKKGIIGKILKGLAHLLDKKAIVSGSGPSLFCLYRTRKEAIRAKAKVLRGVPARERLGWRIFVIGTHR